MELPAAQQLVDGLHRCIRTARGEVAFEVGLEPITAALLPALNGVERIDARFHDHGALCPQVGHGVIEHALHVRVERGALVRLPQNADARALERAAH